MNASSWKKAADIVVKVTPAIPQAPAAAMAELQHLQSLPLSTLSVDDSGPPQVTYESQQPIATSTPRATSTEPLEISTEAYRQILPGMTDRLYPTLVADSSLDTHVPDNQDMLQTQLTSEVDKYLQEVAERRERDVNYFDGRHVATNTISHQQKVDSVEHEEEKILELIDQDTGTNGETNAEHYIRYHEELETIPEESDEEPPPTVQDDVDKVDTIPYTPGDSDDEQFNTAIDDTSEDPMIVMGKPLTTAFVSVNVHVPTEKVGCLQVTNQLKEFLNHFPPESREKAFKQIYEILQVLDAYLRDNPQQHIYCMSPDSEYVSLIMYATKIEIDLCNFLAIWAVLSILLDTQSNTLQHVKSLQQVMNDYYDKCPKKIMSRLEHQITDIMNAMYNSINNDNFDSVSGDTDRVSGAVDNDYDKNDKDRDEMPYDKDKHEMPYDKDNDNVPHDSDNENMPDDSDNDQMLTKYANDYETASDKAKYDENMTNDEPKEVGTKDVVLYNRDDSMMTKVKRPIETNDTDDDFMRVYEEMHKLMEYKQIYDFYEARRHIQSAMEGDTPVKTGQNRQCIDNVRDYDREHERILNSVCHRLDLGPNMLLGAQQHTTVESAAALIIQDRIEGKHDENIHSVNGQYRNELYKRAENMVPQLDGTYNVSDDSDTDLHSYLDLASSSIIAHRTRGQKQRYEINTRANTSRHLALKEGTKPNTNIKTRRQKVPDDENIDINKIARGDRPKDDRNSADITVKQYKENEAKRLALEKAKRIQGQNDTKNTEAKRHMIEKADIEALIEKHRPRTPKTPDEVNTLGTGKDAKDKGQEGTEKVKLHIKRQQRIPKLKSPAERERRLSMPKKANRTHYWVIRLLIQLQVQKRQEKKGKKIKLA